MQQYVLWYEQLGMQDVERVGGKNASLGEMISNLSGAGVSVPAGLPPPPLRLTSFWSQAASMARSTICSTAWMWTTSPPSTGPASGIRDWVIEAPFQSALEQAIRVAYDKLSGGLDASFAVRSSATAEDMPDASFAGQQETFLNVRGIDAVMIAVKHVFASLFNDRAISYRVHQGYDHKGVALSAGIQRMVRSDLAASGVMFTLDTESGFNDVVFITGAQGLGEMVVQGAVTLTSSTCTSRPSRQDARRWCARPSAPSSSR